jgi:hypothetical protein
MPTPKVAAIRARFDYDRFQVFKRLCAIDGTTASDKIRELVDTYIDNHSMVKNRVEIDFEMQKLPKQNKHAFYSYIIEARILDEDNALDLEADIPFMLPEFINDGVEPYRVDSHYQYRIALPNDKSATGRYLGSRFINGEWKGAFFIYDDELLGAPNACFTDIKHSLELNILGSISNLLRRDDQSSANTKIFDEIFVNARTAKWDKSDDEI